MIGWWIVIAAQTPEERDAATDRRAAILADWEISPFGIGWIEQLVDQGKAEQLSFGGYPNRYTAKARDVLTLIADGPPAHDGPAVFGDDYVMSSDWSGNVVLHRDKIAACWSEQVLTIEVWDLS